MKHLFFLSPPKSGSTILWKLIKEQSNVSSMELDEGEKYWCTYPQYIDCWSPVSCRHGLATRKPGYYSNEDNYDWNRIVKVWNQAWNKKDDNRLYLEKSTPNVFRWKMLDKYFENSYFIGVTRNPYSWIMSMINHLNSKNKILASKDLMVDWMVHMDAMIQAKNELKDRMLICTYEDLSPIKTFLPELNNVQIECVDKNKNLARLEEITLEQITAINKVINREQENYIWPIYNKNFLSENFREAMKYFGYKIINTIAGTELPIKPKWTGNYINHDSRFKNDKFTTWFNNHPSQWMINLGLYSKEMITIKEEEWK